ncbi:hypothetical protein R3P38DRAFT_3321667 [Favolaschia claudopus]|uniref:Uncharacterized protein n=1 Tax=Favolaschia claudopus TaxID=2862362 RepID=A0AAW0AQ72_9AGAR
MSRIEDLLNPVSEVDARPQLLLLENFLLKSVPGPILVPPELQICLEKSLLDLKRWSAPPEALVPSPNLHIPSEVQETKTEFDVFINRKTTLSKLYRYPPNTYIEYPETGEQPVGHLFKLDPENWERPMLDFSYSQGKPDGQSKSTEEVFCPVLLDKNGNAVLCVSRFSTCQGMKCCPYNSIEELTEPHTTASRQEVELRLKEERDDRLDCSSPERDIFNRTAAYIATLHKQGCTRSLSTTTVRSASDQEEYDLHTERLVEFRRGYKKPETCEGRLVYHSGVKPYIACEHYSKQNRDHWTDFSISDGSYNIEYCTISINSPYIAAVFTGNTESMDRIEESARLMDYGPLAPCSFLANCSTQRVYCPTEHRDEDHRLYQPKLVQLECKSRFRVFEPIESARADCPFILVICQGTHPHPIPVPEKTPKKVRGEIFKLLENVGEDLPDMTPRRLLRHPAVLAFLRDRLPDIRNPTLSDLHSSLANRSHLNAYIDQAKKIHFPKGTDWNGVLRRKELQDALIDPKEHYIRTLLDLDDSQLPVHEEDEPATASTGNHTRIIICMSPEGSRRLLRAQYLQSDIGFKRIVGFLEFELACLDRDANTSVIFCRIYLNRQTAAAHHRIFQEIESIVRQDTGQRLKWRHLDATSVEQYDGMILHWAADQHRGQAKGLGLHLQALAQTKGRTRDLHEPGRLLADLSPYDHLSRIFRICVVHVYRRIKSAAVPDEVKQLMRNLICITHPEWDYTIERIKDLGGKAGVDWISDKVTARFILPGICWEKSHIPLAIWQAGERNSNLIETVHRDVNREGVHCTLLGGIIKGQRFDSLKMKTLNQYEVAGIRPSYHPVHQVVNATKNQKRKDKKLSKALEEADRKIQEHNTKLAATHGKVNEARYKLQDLNNAFNQQGSDKAMLQTRIETTIRVEARAFASFNEQIAVGKMLVGTGSGNIQVFSNASAAEGLQCGCESNSVNGMWWRGCAGS